MSAGRGGRGYGWNAACALLMILPACSARISSDDQDAGRSDAGAAFADAAGPSLDAATQSPDASLADGGPGTMGAAEFDPSRGGIAACFDGADNDDAGGGADCADTSCQANVPACCVGVSSSTCCVAGVPRDLPFGACGGGVAGCPALAGFDVFGAPSPRVDDSGAGTVFLPGGEGSESGVLFPDALDPRLGTITLTARVATPEPAPSGGQIELVGFGLVDAEIDPGGLGRVAPIAGLRVSRNRREVTLVVAGETVFRAAITTEDFVDYGLTLSPTGRVALLRDGAELAALELGPGLALRAALYGRTSNEPGSGDVVLNTRVASASVSQQRCDMPGALALRPTPALGGAAWADDFDAIGEPDMLRWTFEETTRATMAFMLGDSIYLAEPGPGGLAPTTALDAPVLTEGLVDFAMTAVSSPALRHDGSGELEIWFVGETGGQTTIGVARRRASDGLYRDLTPQLSPAAGERFESVDVYDTNDETRLAVAVRAPDGKTRIEIHRVGRGAVGVVRESRPDTLFAFDRDEVGDPSIDIEGGVHRLYFSGRRGTRWSIGLLVSPDGALFVEPNDPIALEPSGLGFDSLSVRAPSVEVFGDELHLYYEGSDGARSRIGVAIGAAP